MNSSPTSKAKESQSYLRLDVFIRRELAEVGWRERLYKTDDEEKELRDAGFTKQGLVWVNDKTGEKKK